MSDAYSPKMRVDWTVPLWGIISMTMQGLVVVWLIATMNEKIGANTIRIDKIEVRQNVNETNILANAIRIADVAGEVRARRPADLPR